MTFTEKTTFAHSQGMLLPRLKDNIASKGYMHWHSLSIKGDTTERGLI
jgi:hypothetical protein